MLDRVLRTPKQKLLRPLARTLGNVQPTTLTLISFGLGLLAAGLVTQKLYGWGLGLWLLNRLLDGLDGEVARRETAQSDWGGYLDILCDFVVYTLIPLALAASMPSTGAYLSLALLLGSFYLNAGSWLYLAALLEKRRGGAAARQPASPYPQGSSRALRPSSSTPSFCSSPAPSRRLPLLWHYWF